MFFEASGVLTGVMTSALLASQAYWSDIFSDILQHVSHVLQSRCLSLIILRRSSFHYINTYSNNCTIVLAWRFTCRALGCGLTYVLSRLCGRRLLST